MNSALAEFAGYLRRPPPFVADGVKVFPVHPRVSSAVSLKGAVVHAVERAAGVVEGGRIRYAAWWLCGLTSRDVAFVPDAGLPGAAICEHCKRGAPGIFVYCCRDRDGHPLYAGFTEGLGARLKNHSFAKDWWPQVAEITRTPYTTIAEARAAERLLILTEKPAFNRLWNKAAA